MKTLCLIVFTILISTTSFSQTVFVSNAGTNMVNGSYSYVGDIDEPYYKKGAYFLYHYNNNTWIISKNPEQGPDGEDVYYYVASFAFSPVGLTFTDIGDLGINPCPTAGSSPLPVELTTFSVTVVDNDVQLDWETATEVNNYGFEIERLNSESVSQQIGLGSQKSEWELIGFVEGHGNSNSPKNYSFREKLDFYSGKYFYRLKQIDIDGQFEYSDEVEVKIAAPINFSLEQNYPNPFNPVTNITYSIPDQTHVKLIIYNLFGEEVTRLVNGIKEAGVYNVRFTANNLASGIYIYSIETENFTATKRLLLLK